MKNFLVTGTDTEIGKTYVTTLIIQSLKAKGVNVAGYKPIACGDRQDPRQIREAMQSDISLEEINPVYLKNATCPYVAAKLENIEIDCGLIMRGYEQLVSQFETVIVEGVGGWEVPIGPQKLFSDLAVEFGLPVILVVGNKLGALNHALLTLEAIQAKGLECAGIIFNNVSDSWNTACVTNRSMIEEFTKVPVLAELIHGQDYFDLDDLATALS